MIELAGNIIIEDSKVLLLYRKDEKHWEVPGGKVKENESATKAAVRETKEEIGVKTQLEKPFYSGEFQKENQLYLWHGYLAKIKEGEPELQEDKFEKLKWISKGQLDQINLAPNIEMIEPGLRRLLNKEQN